MFTSMIERGATRVRAVVLAGLVVGALACGGPSQAPGNTTPGSSTAANPGAAGAAGSVGDAAAEVLPAPAFEAALPEGMRALLSVPFTGDLDGMVKRRLIRIGVTYNRTFYFIDKGVQRGVVYEYGKLFEDELNKKLKTGNLRINVAFVPLPRELLASALVNGRIDAVVAQVTVTPERQRLVDFTKPTRKGVDEVVVTGPGAPAVSTIADLSGKDVYVREGSIYHQSLAALNETLAAQGRPPVKIQFAADGLEDDDLLEMANAGLIPITVVDDYLATFWKQVFTNLTVHDTMVVRTGGELAVAMRKGSPELKAALDEFLGRNGLGTAFGNMIQKRYLADTKFVKNAMADADRKKFLALVELFRKYSEQYDLDPLLMAAQGYQESGLNQDAKSAVGAIGVMQVMPATGKELNVGDITKLEANIHAGVKYVRFMIDQYYKDEPMTQLNKGLFAFASYNAGPARVRQLRREAEKRGLDPNTWFGNVEQIASERIGRETVTYVSNIYKYYVAYQLVFAERQRREALKGSPQ